jgi:hypothetical protein
MTQALFQDSQELFQDSQEQYQDSQDLAVTLPDEELESESLKPRGLNVAEHGHKDNVAELGHKDNVAEHGHTAKAEESVPKRAKLESDPLYPMKFRGVMNFI